MKISVKMTSDEFVEFEKWRRERGRYEFDLGRVRREPERIASSLAYAVEQVEGKPEEFKIISQDHMADVWDMIKEFLPD